MNVELTGNFFKGASHSNSRALTTLRVTQRFNSCGYVRTIDARYACFKCGQKVKLNRLPRIEIT